MAGGEAGPNPYCCFTLRLIGDQDKPFAGDRSAEAGLFSLTKRLGGHRSQENQTRRRKQWGVNTKELRTKI